MLKIKTPVVNEVVLLLLWLIWKSLHWQLNLNLVHRSLNRGADQIK